jgi:membrane fusion protein, multidrug efflux system
VKILARVALAAILVPGCLSCNRGDAIPTAPTARPRSDTSAPAPDPDPPAAPAEANFFQSSGPIVVENQVDVAAQRDGVVVEIAADTGQRVHKGDLLAKLDNRQLVSDREAAQGKLESIEADVKNWEAEEKVLQADLDRAQKMWDAHIISKEVFEHTQYNALADQYELLRERKNYSSQLAVVHSLDLELLKTQIAAPFDGVVARRYVRVGQRVEAGARLFWVTAVSPLHVRFTLPERFVQKVAPGDSVTVSSLDPQASIHAARIIQVSPVVDPASNTIEIVAEILGAPNDLRPGMKANVRIRDPR